LNIANYAGDSGAPIFTVPQSIQYDKKNNTNVVGGLPITFLGIHHEGWTTHSSLGFKDATEDDGSEEQMVLASYIKAATLKNISSWISLV
jgi:hypothetical protein